MRSQIRGQEPALPSTLRSGIPRNLEIIALNCLHKDPRERYPTALDVAQDLRRFIRGEPIKARPNSYRRRLWRWCGRPERIRDAGIAGSVSTAIALGASVIGSLLVFSGVLPAHDYFRAGVFFGSLLAYCACSLFVVWNIFRSRAWALWLGTILPSGLAICQLLIGLGFIDTGESLPLKDDPPRLVVATTVVMVTCLTWSAASTLGLISLLRQVGRLTPVNNSHHQPM